MYVRRVRKPRGLQAEHPTIFFFENHYVMARSYALEGSLHNVSVLTIDGFQCPTVLQDAEQNALLKALLFSPFACTDPLRCGNTLNFRGLLSNNSHGHDCNCGASQPALSPVLPCLPQGCAYTYQRAWKLRKSEMEVLAQRAETRIGAARKRLVLADTILFADMKEPMAAIEYGEQVKMMLFTIFIRHLRRTPPLHGVRTILAFLGQPCRWHEEQCTLAEFSAYLGRDVMICLLYTSPSPRDRG